MIRTIATLSYTDSCNWVRGSEDYEAELHLTLGLNDQVLPLARDSEGYTSLGPKIKSFKTLTGLKNHLNKTYFKNT